MKLFTAKHKKERSFRKILRPEWKKPFGSTQTTQKQFRGVRLPKYRPYGFTRKDKKWEGSFHKNRVILEKENISNPEIVSEKENDPEVLEKEEKEKFSEFPEKEKFSEKENDPEFPEKEKFSEKENISEFSKKENVSEVLEKENDPEVLEKEKFSEKENVSEFSKKENVSEVLEKENDPEFSKKENVSEFPEKEIVSEKENNSRPESSKTSHMKYANTKPTFSEADPAASSNVGTTFLNFLSTNMGNLNESIPMSKESIEKALSRIYSDETYIQKIRIKDLDIVPDTYLYKFAHFSQDT